MVGADNAVVAIHVSRPTHVQWRAAVRAHVVDGHDLPTTRKLARSTASSANVSWPHLSFDGIILRPTAAYVTLQQHADADLHTGGAHLAAGFPEQDDLLAQDLNAHGLVLHALRDGCAYKKTSSIELLNQLSLTSAQNRISGPMCQGRKHCLIERD